MNWPKALLQCDNIVFAGKFGKEETMKRLRSYIKDNKMNVNVDEIEEKSCIIPNGVSTEIFKPLENKGEIKKKCWKLPENAFIIGYFGRQNPRKGLPYALEAFAKWQGRPDNVYFYCHTPLGDKSGWDLLQMNRDLGIQEKVMVNTNIEVEKGVSEKELNEFYNACDVVASPSLGEGFGQTTCVLPGAMIRTEKGYIPIENVKTGDKVMTHMGRFQSVKETFKSWHEEGTCCSIITDNSPQFSVTPTHKVLTKYFKKAINLTIKDYLKFPVSKENSKTIEALNKEFKLDQKFPKNQIATKDPNVAFRLRDLLYARNRSIFNIIKQGGNRKTCKRL